ncbi:MAG: histone deacetylase family protein [Steroidobacteraceae bacterium]
MRTILAAEHARHRPEQEFSRGRFVPAFEGPQRVDSIVEALRDAQLGPIEAPEEFPLEPILRIHGPAYVDFLERAHRDWVALGRSGDAYPVAWAIRGLRNDRVPQSLDGQLSHYSFDFASPITAGTWVAARSAANAALTGARLVGSGAEPVVFGLCRPPGHHAASDYFGGYCYLNNAAVAAQSLLDEGMERVAVLDVDYHHGNGTQSIFYRSREVLFVSIHADPATDYPYFLGYADETGEAEGEGCNLNLPLARGTDWSRWGAALDRACQATTAFGAQAIVVSLGLDTFRSDPLSSFQLDSADYLKIGARIARLARPTLFLLEGGYAVRELGLNAVNVLRGFEGG